VVEIDAGNSKVRVKRLEDGKEWWEAYDQLVVATGALPIRPRVPGAEAEGIFGINTLQSGIDLRRAVDRNSPKRAVIIGGGYIGLEMAEVLTRRGLEISLVERAPQVMNTLDADMGELVSEALSDVGVRLYLEESLVGFETEKGRVAAVTTDRRRIPADIVVLGMGVRPNVSLAEAAGIAIGTTGGIRVDDRMRTGTERIWAAGDCAESFHLVSRRPVYIALGTVANKQGRVAGLNIAGGDAVFPGVVGTAVSKICSVEVARTGLQEKEIRRLELEHVSGRIESTTRAGYYPGAGRITVKLLAEAGTGRLFGGQIVGVEGAAKRIDVIATALHCGLRVEELIDLDLSYAPPYSPLWDPVLVAARRTMKAVRA
jgi:NADPH-dependent 2,4-dienoyl-CoA reductase/sulfur reductase-like enzyme